ncbi:MAG: glycosyltransferase 87 family protein [Actinobacteria bacterium]|nr:glycosyltransferase 87 family protein [Actinomycetota bacterium]
MSPSTQQRSPAWAIYAVIAVAWLATRAFALMSVDMTPWMLNDLDIYAAWLPLLQDGAFPTGDPTWQYPPGIAPVFLIAGAIPTDFRWAFTLVILAADAAIMAALMRAHARRAGSSWRGLWIWALAGLIVGSIMMVRFDVVPTMFAVGAVLLVARPALSGVSTALGLTVKVWPALMLFVLPRRSLTRGVLAFIATAVVVLAAFGILTDNSLSFIGNQQARGLQVESVGALPYELFTLFGGQVAFGLKYGSIQVLMQGTEAVGLAMTVAGLALFALLAWARLSGRLESVPAGDVALTVMLVAVATSRVYSPQFNVWLVGLAAVALINAASRQRLVVTLVIGVSLLTQIVYPWSATQLVTGEPVAIIAQTLRIAGLMAAVVLALLAILRTPRAATREG